MFFVFGPSGQIYRGDTALLPQTARVQRVRRPLALRSRPAQDQTWPLEVAGQAAAPQTAPPHLREAEAAAAYAQTAQGAVPSRQPLTHVRDVMTQGVITLIPGMALQEAWQLLAQHTIGQAPVVDDAGRVVGLLRRADMVPVDWSSVSAQGLAVWVGQPVAQVMLSPVPAVTPDADLRRVAQVLLDTSLPGLAVTDEAGSPLGFVSRTDILRAVVADPPLDLWT